MGWPVSKAAAPSEPAVPAFQATGSGKPKGVHWVRSAEVLVHRCRRLGSGVGSGCG